MKKLNSIIALIVGVSAVVGAQFQPDIKDFVDAHPYITPILGALMMVWNNLSQPVHKP